MRSFSFLQGDKIEGKIQYLSSEFQDGIWLGKCGIERLDPILCSNINVSKLASLFLMGGVDMAVKLLEIGRISSGVAEKMADTNE